MATIARRVAKGFVLPPPATRLLGVTGSTGVFNNDVPSCSMHSKTSGLIEPLAKPFDYKRIHFNNFWHLFDGTTKRFNANSKMIVVEGPPALDKTKFAQELADEFGMKFVPGFTMDDMYTSPYGFDIRELDEIFAYVRNKSFDEKKFAVDPTAQDGALDRMLYAMFTNRYLQYAAQLGHIFSTGEGVVTERSPHSDWVYFEAAYRQGWIAKSTRSHYFKLRNMIIDRLLRPNMIIYLDAPVSVVQEKIRARAENTHPWEKNSPVYENTDYLDHLYEDLFKKQYLPTAGISSYVLTYDWSEGGDTEVVVEDIDRMEMDYHDKYDKQQEDWRLLTEDNFATQRKWYGSGEGLGMLAGQFNAPFFGADNIFLSSDEANENDMIKSRIPGSQYLPGYNTNMGDPEPFFNWGFNVSSAVWGDSKFYVENAYDNPDLRHSDRIRENRKAMGDPNWWKAGWEGWNGHGFDSK